jgi:hypothetical protein
VIGTQAKITRNEKLVKMRLDGNIWNDVAAAFGLSVARAKEIFYREAKKNNINIKVKRKNKAGDNSN